MDTCKSGGRGNLPLVIVGHVDHGKSTIVGRLLADTGSLPNGKLEQVREFCARNSRPFEYAFLLDALKDEQAQGITIDSARVFFKTEKRDYILIDAPGHIEFLKNMVSGASRAHAALLVIDAKEGIQENSRRHGYMLSLLGIKQVAVLVNKMDLVGYQESAFKKISSEYAQFLSQFGLVPTCFVPVAGLHGDNLAERSKHMPWCRTGSVLEVLDRFEEEKPPIEQAFRMPVQGVYKFTAAGDTRRIVAGTVVGGRAQVGSEVVFFPSQKRSRIASIEGFPDGKGLPIEAGNAVGFTLETQIYVTRGELATLATEDPPSVARRLTASVFWLGRAPLISGKTYVMKTGTARVSCVVERIQRVMNASTLTARSDATEVRPHEVADCILKLERPTALDLAEGYHQTGRFVLVDDYELSGGGIVREVFADHYQDIVQMVNVRNEKWETSLIPLQRRSERLGQKPALVLVTGDPAAPRKEIAKSLETALFDAGRSVYYMGIGNLIYGVSADLQDRERDWIEHLRRVAEVAHLLMDAGLIVIVTAQELRQRDLDVLQSVIPEKQVFPVWAGERTSTDLRTELQLEGTVNDSVGQIRSLLEARRIVLSG